MFGREAPLVSVFACLMRVSIRPKAERFARRRRALRPGAKRPYSGALSLAVGGFQFGRRPNHLCAIGELCVRARRARYQMRSACVIARRKRVSIQSMVEPFVRRILLAVGYIFVRARSAISQGRNACVIARRRWFLIWPKADHFARRR